MKQVKVKTKRRCPYCQSDKWEWIETIPATLEEIEKFLLMKYKCIKCGKEFEAEEIARAKIVDDVDRCFNCNSQKISLISKPDADINLYFCEKCHCYMGVEKDGK